jgi:hypothetical protein
VITPREMSQLFHAITSMQAINISGVHHVQMQSILQLLGTYSEGYPQFSMEKMGDGEYMWSMRYPDNPIPLTEEVKDTEDESRADKHD